MYGLAQAARQIESEYGSFGIHVGASPQWSLVSAFTRSIDSLLQRSKIIMQDESTRIKSTRKHRVAKAGCAGKLCKLHSLRNSSGEHTAEPQHLNTLGPVLQTVRQ